MIGLSGEIPLVSHTDVTSPFPPSGNEGYTCNRDVFYSKIKYGRNTGQTGGLTGMDTGKTVPQFYTDYIIR